MIYTNESKPKILDGVTPAMAEHINRTIETAIDANYRSRHAEKVADKAEGISKSVRDDADNGFLTPNVTFTTGELLPAGSQPTVERSGTNLFPEFFLRVPEGRKGDSGILVPLQNGFLRFDVEDGFLYLLHHAGIEPPNLSIDEDKESQTYGELFWNMEEG
ncbi:MAG: hypothetical protein FWE31_05970 [Firmicutes bacterium]|nr:hypothetical protein [Bacillota bacterium]